MKCAHSCAADLGQEYLPLLPRLQEPGVLVLPSQGKAPGETPRSSVMLPSETGCREVRLPVLILCAVLSNSLVALRRSANDRVAPSTTRPRPCLQDTP